MLTYAEVADRATRIAASVGEASRVGILAGRTPTAYAAVLGTLIAEAAYVPMNVSFPDARNRAILQRSGASTVIVDSEGIARLPGILTDVEETIVVADDVGRPLRPINSRHPVVSTQAATSPGLPAPKTVDPEALAYLMFTSGSTGGPKGVAVSHGNVRAFVERMIDRYDLTCADRVSQMFDLTFDLSVFDQFMTWEAGACLVCPSRAELLNPATLIQQKELTVWFSVPSVAMFMRRLGSLSPQAFPSLRWSLFCGEPLPADIADAWLAAANRSTVENLYGPTELTIACTAFRWRGKDSARHCIHGIVPIGEPLPRLEALIVDASLREVSVGGEGELIVSGDQVTLGYWNDRERTDAAFVTPPERSERYYRTGDLVTRRTLDEPLCYLGRLDHQIKVLGHRVELLEIEAALRSASGLDSVAAIGWPRTASGAAGVVAFVAGVEIDTVGIRTTLASRLPAYMVPRQIHELQELPVNSNGKVDRQALERLLQPRELP